MCVCIIKNRWVGDLYMEDHTNHSIPTVITNKQKQTPHIYTAFKEAVDL